MRGILGLRQTRVRDRARLRVLLFCTQINDVQCTFGHRTFSG